MKKIYDNPEKYDNGKMTPKEWAEHIWYHYKWVLIIGVLVAMFVVIALVQFLQNDEPDVRIMHVGPMYISPAAADKIEATLTPMSGDYNDDGEIHFNILDITINKFSNETSDLVVNYDENNEGYTRFQTEIRAGDSVIYLLDEPYFNICVEEGILAPFDEIIDDAYMPENVISGCGVKISELDAYSLEGLSSIPETAILCIRRSPAEDELSYGRSEEEWEGNRQTFVNIIKYRSETK